MQKLSSNARSSTCKRAQGGGSNLNSCLNLETLALFAPEQHRVLVSSVGALALALNAPPSRASSPLAALQRTMELSDFGGVFAMGATLSVEERAALEVQMAKKRVEEKLHS